MLVVLRELEGGAGFTPPHLTGKGPPDRLVVRGASRSPSRVVRSVAGRVGDTARNLYLRVMGTLLVFVHDADLALVGLRVDELDQE
jgi:hypothetical protein